jgi:hypothetical protein
MAASPIKIPRRPDPLGWRESLECGFWESGVGWFLFDLRLMVTSVGKDDQ